MHWGLAEELVRALVREREAEIERRALERLAARRGGPVVAEAAGSNRGANSASRVLSRPAGVRR